VLGPLSPDLVILQEATDSRVVERLGEILELPHRVTRPGTSVAAIARERARHVWHDPARGRTFLELEPAGSDLRLIGLHLPSGLSGRGERARLRAIDGVLAATGDGADERTLLIGDLNSVGPGDEPVVARMPTWLRVLLRFDGGIRTHVLDRLSESGWTDAFRWLHPTAPGFTLPARDPQVRLDYLLAPTAVLPRIRTCEPVSDGPFVRQASDHLPLLSVIDDAD
jgi:endonuclease/exonuclease/phosphatase family metal-dependent hydrolase